MFEVIEATPAYELHKGKKKNLPNTLKYEKAFVYL